MQTMSIRQFNRNNDIVRSKFYNLTQHVCIKNSFTMHIYRTMYDILLIMPTHGGMARLS